MRSGRPQILAHRAGPLRRGVPRHAEQTLPAFAETWARERVVCELDVRFTADGHPVVFHDATLQRLTGVTGNLADCDLASYRALRADILGSDRVLARAGTPVPLATLGQVLGFAHRSGAHLDVELKNLPGESGFDPTTRTAERLARALLASGIGARRLTVQSFRVADVAVLRALMPRVRASMLVTADFEETGIESAIVAAADAVGLAWPVAPELVRDAHQRGLFVMTYTVNDPDGVRAAARAGVDAIITDDPTAARLALTTSVVSDGGRGCGCGSAART